MLAELPKFVVSGSRPDPDDGVQVIRENAVHQVAELVGAETRDVVLLAGGRLVGDLLRAGLLTEIVLIVGTVLIGAGRPLLEGLDAQTELELLEAQAYPPTTTWLHYRLR